MSTFTTENLQALFLVVDALRAANMSKAIIGPDVVRAADESLTAAILSKTADILPKDGTAELGIMRVAMLYDRLCLLSGQTISDLNLETSADGTYYAKLTAKTATHAIEFRFADPSVIERVPKTPRGEVVCEFSLTKDQVSNILGGVRAYQAEFVWFHANNDGIKVEMFDVSNDKLTIQLSDETVDDPISQKYTAQSIINALGQKADTSKGLKCEVLDTGALRTPFKGLTLYTLRGT